MSMDERIRRQLAKVRGRGTGAQDPGRPTVLRVGAIDDAVGSLVDELAGPARTLQPFGPEGDRAGADAQPWSALEDASFDVVVAGPILEREDFFWITLLEIERVMAPEALLLVSIPPPALRQTDPGAVWRFGPDSLRAMARWMRLEVVELSIVGESTASSAALEGWRGSVLVARKPRLSGQRALRRLVTDRMLRGVLQDALKRHRPPIPLLSPKPATRASRPTGNAVLHRDLDSAYHDQIGLEYDRVVNDPRRVLNDHVFSEIGRSIRRGDTMLDLGAGTGQATLRFAEKFGAVIAVDHSRTMLAAARENFQRRGLTHVTIHEGSIEQFMRGVPPGSVDAICCIGFLHHLGDEEVAALVSASKQALRPLGQLLISEPREVDPSTLPSEIADWNARSIAGGLQYASQPREPDEAPLKESWLVSLLLSRGFTLEQVVHNWEIFPHSVDPGPEERAKMLALHERHGHAGNVFTVLAYA